MTTPAAPVWAPWTSFYDPTGQGPKLIPQVAADGHAVSFELNGFVLSLPGQQDTAQDAVLVGATALSGALSVELPAEYNLAAFLLVVRGNLEASALTEVAVSCSIGHSTQSLQWPSVSPVLDPSGPRSDDDPIPTVTLDLSLECFASDTRPGGVGVSNSLPPIPITLSMQARRRTADELIVVQLESIDVIMLGLP
jgi:hypothetical protein